jgi:hypothetical protein
MQTSPGYPDVDVLAGRFREDAKSSSVCHCNNIGNYFSLLIHVDFRADMCRWRLKQWILTSQGRDGLTFFAFFAFVRHSMTMLEYVLDGSYVKASGGSCFRPGFFFLSCPYKVPKKTAPNPLLEDRTNLWTTLACTPSTWSTYLSLTDSVS